jgi:hypothetical protein
LTTAALIFVGAGLTAAKYSDKDKELVKNIELLFEEIQEQLTTAKHGSGQLVEIAANITTSQLKVNYFCLINVALIIVLIGLLYRGGRSWTLTAIVQNVFLILFWLIFLLPFFDMVLGTNISECSVYKAWPKGADVLVEDLRQRALPDFNANYNQYLNSH